MLRLSVPVPNFLFFLALTASVAAASPAQVDSLTGRVLAGRSVLAQVAAQAQGGGAAGSDHPAGPALVLGADSGIGGVRVTLIDNADPKAIFVTKTASDGRFSVAGVPAGTYRMTLLHPTLGERSLQAMVGEGAGEVVFVWETAAGKPPGEMTPPPLPVTPDKAPTGRP